MRRFLVIAAIAVCVTGGIAGTANGTPPPGIHHSGVHPSAAGASAQNVHRPIVP